MIEVTHLPVEIGAGASETSLSPMFDYSVSNPSKIRALIERIHTKQESFWTTVYAAFTARDITREDVRHIIATGLRETDGSYRLLVALYNMPSGDYKRFLGFLSQYRMPCAVPAFSDGAREHVGTCRAYARRQARLSDAPNPSDRPTHAETRDPVRGSGSRRASRRYAIRVHRLARKRRISPGDSGESKFNHAAGGAAQHVRERLFAPRPETGATRIGAANSSPTRTPVRCCPPCEYRHEIESRKWSATRTRANCLARRRRLEKVIVGAE